MKETHSRHIEEVTIIGGTHGNEYLGPYFIGKIEALGLYQGSSLKVTTLLANPRAFDLGLRFIDSDLNRSFSTEVLNSKHPQQIHEHELARKISRQLDVKDPSDPFIIDLHSTTANMGITLIVRDDQPFNLHAAAYVKQNIPEARILISDLNREKSQSLNTLSQFGLTVEIGPIANSVIRQDQFEITEKVVDQLIRFITLCTAREEPRLPETVTAYRARTRMPFPRDCQGKLTAMVHKDLQDRDYRLLEPGMPVFRTFDNEDILFDGKPGYSVFINEAAYYKENVAFFLTDKVDIPLK